MARTEEEKATVKKAWQIMVEDHKKGVQPLIDHALKIARGEVKPQEIKPFGTIRFPFEYEAIQEALNVDLSSAEPIAIVPREDPEIDKLLGQIALFKTNIPDVLIQADGYRKIEEELRGGPYNCIGDNVFLLKVGIEKREQILKESFH